MPPKTHKAQLSLIFSDFREQLLPSVKNAHTIPKIVERIKHWTGTSPELAHVVCTNIVRSAIHVDEAEPEKVVDRVVTETILNDWEGSQVAEHLHRLTRQCLHGEEKDLKLLSYLRVLQLGSVDVAMSLQHAALLDCGLIVKVGSKVEVANAVYAHIFDIDWIEQQLPGITRPVTVIDSRVSSESPSKGLGLYSKVTVFACCLAVAGVAFSIYRSESGNEAFATQENSATIVTRQDLEGKITSVTTDLEQVDSPGESTAEGKTPVTAQLDQTTDRARFDKGVEHATSSRWLLMVREFCQIPTDSSYFMLAERQLSSWVDLYREDIEIANAAFIQEESDECSLVSKGLTTK